MPVVIPVKFRYAARELWFDPQDTGAREGDHVICNTARGVEMGLATLDPFEISQAELDDTIGEATLNNVLKIADADDYAKADVLAQKSDEAFPTFRKLAKEAGLDMKPVASEYIFGEDKVVCYFAAEERVDFRQLVKDLSHAYSMRIDMRQIGVREEAALAGGFAHCGQELCCSRFGSKFEPVSIRMAKEQDLPLNSSKISGACGRLMCCLRYEFEAYRDFKSRAPKRNAIIDTPLGKAKIQEYDTPKEQLVLRLEDGKQVRVPLGEMTCSASAKEKACSNGCNCRPDTVSRDVLEKIQTPEIQMALAEIDRENGEDVYLDEEFSSDDIFVKTPRKRRSNNNKNNNKSNQNNNAPKKRNRRVNKSENNNKDNSNSNNATKGPKRRVRKTVKPADNNNKQAQENSNNNKQNNNQPKKKRGMQPRRKHANKPDTAKKQNNNQNQEGKVVKKQVRRAGKTRTTAKRRVTRKPGDKGGQPNPDPAPAKPKRRKRKPNNTGDKPVNNSDKPKTNRRKRNFKKKKNTQDNE